MVSCKPQNTFDGLGIKIIFGAPMPWKAKGMDQDSEIAFVGPGSACQWVKSLKHFVARERILIWLVMHSARKNTQQASQD